MLSLRFQLIKASWFQCLSHTKIRFHLIYGPSPGHQKLPVLNEEQKHEAEYHTLDSCLRII